MTKAGPLALSLLLWLAPAAQAEVYRWTDDTGQVHFTQSLSQVPAAQRGRAEREAAAREERPSRLQTFRAPAAVPAARALLRSNRVYAIPFESQGGAMLVQVRLNDRVTAPFLVDTGASDVTVPLQVALAAGVSIGPETPRAIYHTANGEVSQAIVSLDSLQLGDVRVEGVRGSVSPSLQVGLLGGSFFNNFTFQVDPAARVIHLSENPNVRAGVTETEWRERFRTLRDRLAKLSAYLEGNHLTDRGRVAELEAKRDELSDALASLDHEADRLDVPHAWRQ